MTQHMYTPGDLLRIHGENDEDWYAEILESNGEELEVCYLRPRVIKEDVFGVFQMILLACGPSLFVST